MSPVTKSARSFPAALADQGSEVGEGPVAVGLVVGGHEVDPGDDAVEAAAAVAVEHACGDEPDVLATP